MASKRTWARVGVCVAVASCIATLAAVGLGRIEARSRSRANRIAVQRAEAPPPTRRGTPPVGARRATLAPSARPDLAATVEPAERPFDVGEVIANVHFGFRADADADELVAGDASFERRVSPSGAIELVARGDANGVHGSRAVARLSLGRRTITRGGVPLAARPAIEVDRGRVTLSGDGLVETLANDARGLEQSWTLVREPEGSGELAIAVPVAGARFVSVTAGGVHFAAAGSGLGFRYGHATVIDADGHTTSIPVRHEHGALALAIPDELLHASRYPLVIDPVIAAEVGVDGAAPGTELVGTTDPDVAWNGSEYLVVWADSRVGGTGPGIYGARVTSSGAVLDVAGFPIATSASATFSAPAIASNEPDYLVVWRSTATSNGYQSVRGARVTGSRVVLDATPMTISSLAAVPITDPVVASNGNNYAVAWNGRGARVYADGNVYDPGGSGSDTGDVLSLAYYSTSDAYLAIRPSGSSYQIWTLSYVGGGYWGWDGFTQNLPATFAAYSPSIRCVPEGSFYSDCVIAWIEDTNPFPLPTMRNLQVVGWANGQMTSNTPVTLASGALANASLSTRGPAGWYVAYTANATTTPDLRGVSFPNSSNPVPTHETLSNAAPSGVLPRVASGGSTALVFANASTRFVVASGTGAGASGPYYAAVRSSRETMPAVTGNAQGYLVAWHDDRIPTGIYAVRTSNAGSVLDPTGLFVGATSSTTQRPAVASNGTDFAVGYVGASSVVRRIVGSTGQLLDPGGLVVGVGSRPALASNGADYLAVGESAGTVLGRRVTSAGVVQGGAAFTIGSGQNAAVASNGAGFLATWDTAGGDIRAARVDGAGTVLDASGFVVSAAANAQSTPTVASDGTDYFVAWSDLRAGAADIYGARVSSATLVPDQVIDDVGIAISTATSAQTAPCLSWNGTEYLTVWSDTRGISVDVFGTRVSPAGVVEDAALGTALAGQTTLNEIQPSVASGLPDSHLLAYVYDDAGQPYFGASRVRTRAVSYGAVNGSICSANGDCDSGYCVDGVCCATECAGGPTDCQACAVAFGAATDGVCATVSVFSRYVCRASVGPCDAEEWCNGSSTTCPGNTVHPAGFVCRAATPGSCDVAETCSGFATDCPSDQVVPSGTVCRASVGLCDVAETCDGLDPACPANAFESSGFACRPSAGTCDVGEVCDGNGPQCPGDVVQPDGTTCRAAVGVCDVTEYCNGVAPSCPADGFAGNTTPCDAAHGACDFPDFCTGASSLCPELVVPDGTSCDDAHGCTESDACAAGQCVGTRSIDGTVCRVSEGACDVVESCDGLSDDCPANVVHPVDTVCRASSGPCDSAEICDGLSPACPGDVRSPAGTTCRSAAGACDIEEQCSGTSAQCPPDGVKPVGSVCRGAVTACDASEFCEGGPSCPTDGVVADGTPCDDALACTQTSSCQVGACQSSLSLDCSDGNACTTDSCAEPGGCTHTLIASCVADAGTDAGSQPGVDGGTTTPPSGGGCSCSVGASDSTPSATTWMALVGLAIAVVRTRSERASARNPRRDAAIGSR